MLYFPTVTTYIYNILQWMCDPYQLHPLIPSPLFFLNTNERQKKKVEADDYYFFFCPFPKKRWRRRPKKKHPNRIFSMPTRVVFIWMKRRKKRGNGGARSFVMCIKKIPRMKATTMTNFFRVIADIFLVGEDHLLTIPMNKSFTETEQLM